MSKIYLKKVKGGDCPDCFCKYIAKYCCSEFNTYDKDSWICSRDDIHYKQVFFPEVTK